MNVNPITRLDYPDPDVIRVEDTCGTEHRESVQP